MEHVFTDKEHVAWLKEQAEKKRPYWYGTYYLKCTEELLQKKKRQYPDHYTSGRMARYRQDIAAGQICGDCVNGAIKGAIWSELGKRKPVYGSHGCPDTNADGMFEKCKKMGMPWGPIDTIPDKPGVAVRFAGHVGVYVGGGEVVEWRGFAYGCVRTKLKARKWLHWYELPWTEYTGEVQAGVVEKPTAEAGTLGARLLMRGVRGEDVRLLQETLNGMGYDCGEADGVFGANTEKGVREYQMQNDLVGDGKYGPKTHEALMRDVAEKSAQEEDDEDAPEQPKKHVLVTGGTVNIRKGAGTQYDVVAVVRKGARLGYIATADNGWHAVSADGVNGWIGPKYSRVEV